MKQADLALVSGTGVRFTSDLENGKETCVVGKTLKVMENSVSAPPGERVLAAVDKFARQECMGASVVSPTVHRHHSILNSLRWAG